MWSAANDGARRRRHRDKRRRTVVIFENENDQGGDIITKSNTIDTDAEEDGSDSDGERSTTESIHGDSSPSARLTLQTGDAALCGNNAKRKRKKKKQRQIIVREEYPEALVARLTSSYTAAMNGVGALHRTSRQYEANAAAANVNVRDAFDSIQCVAQTARKAFEQSILLDHVILAPVFLHDNKENTVKAKNNRVVQNNAVEVTSSAWLDQWNHSSSEAATTAFQTISITKWNKLSTAHRKDICKVAYLAFVNYADLLLCCLCTNASVTTSKKKKKKDILDRGAVSKLQVMNLFSTMSLPPDADNLNATNRVWSNESTEQTIRLALAAYVDASELDPTDPTLWFKMACAARALGWEISSPKSLQNMCAAPPMSYRCLERLALERGLASLPLGVPPNRLLLHAWREMENWDKGPHAMPECSVEQEINHDDDMLVQQGNEPIQLILQLPKYSWVTLGRMLMKASQEGVAYSRTKGSPRPVWSTVDHAEFGSPQVGIKIAPLLAVPHLVLRIICEHLEETDLKSLACTCRAMPSGLKFARAERVDKMIENEEAYPPKEKLVTSADGTVENIDEKITTYGVTHTKSDLKSKSSRRGTTSPTPGGRISKRVRSHMITTEKQAERKSKRSSVEYCLIAGTLSCTAQNPDYSMLLNADLPLLVQCIDNHPSLSQAHTDDSGWNSSVRSAHSHINHFVSPTSLNEFALKWSKQNSGPRELLEEFLIHISLNTREVFETLLVDKDSLSSCIIDCFDMVRRNVESDASTPWYETAFTPWYCVKTSNDISIVAVNLLHAELLFKRSESQDFDSHEDERDLGVLEFVVKHLLTLLPTISRIDNSESKSMLVELKCRCLWLATSYYLWTSRCSSDASISKSDEVFGLECLDEAIALLSSELKQNETIMTPHLGSTTRRGEHWHALSAELLMQYKEHIQSSSIVTIARQCFQDIQIDVKERSGSSCDDIGNLSPDNKAKLASLGLELIDRYTNNVDKSTDAIEELLNDFVVLKEDRFQPLANALSSGSIEIHWGELWKEIPSSAADINVLSSEGSRPSIIQVLASSLMTTETMIPSVFMIYSKVVCATLLRNQKMSRLRANPLNHADESKVASSIQGQSIAENSRNRRDHLLIAVANFFVDKMASIISSYMNEAETLESLLDGDDFCGLIFASLDICHRYQKHGIDDFNLQTYLLASVSRLVLYLRQYIGLSEQTRQKIESTYFAALTKLMIRTNRDFVDLTSSIHDKRTKEWQSQITSNSRLISLIAVEIAEMLSLCPTKLVADASVSVSHLITSLSSFGETDSYALLAQFVEALLMLWGFLTNSLDASSPFENSARNVLMVPIASVIIALCGCPGASIEGTHRYEEIKSDKSAISFSDYFDSDDSVNCLFLTGTTADGDQLSQRTWLRKLCQCVQCISIVFNSVNEKLIKENTSCRPFPSNQHGPFLPLIAVRVLSNLSEGIFHLFSEDVWGVTYPYGARECGSMIDSLLGEAYLYIYGFSFSGGDADTEKAYAPESITSAVHLFRCIKRVYHDNRKTPPTKGFESIELALPPAEESKASKAIKAFLFDGDKMREELIRTSTSVLADLPPGFPEWVFHVEDTSLSIDDEERNIDLLRRGVARELAKVSLANLDSTQKSPSDMDKEQGLTAEREMAQTHELSLYQKFRSVLTDLCYCPKNVENWMALSECFGFKAEDICDRLVRFTDPTSDFCLNSKSKREFPATMTLEQLQRSQLEDYQESCQDWRPFLGKNMFAYMQYPWSNFQSLQNCAQEVLSTIPQTDATDASSDYMCWKSIASKFDAGDYVSWANSWGGMFIMALRTMKLKALMVARYLAKTSQHGLHPSEVCVDIGTSLYSELQLSTVYGYPKHPMTQYEKRCLAENAKFFFHEAVNLSSSCEYAQKCDIIPFELYFMIGKVLEKNASTVREEMYAWDTEGNCQTRLYETLMNESILNYFKAYTDAQKAEQSSGGRDKSHTGGSSHGSLECLYRLHASRFKVLLSAVRRSPHECELAESEALHISSSVWFDKSNDSSSVIGVRGKIWDILADCVDAFNKCRVESPQFHRSLYRLAQAYNFSPLFHNPNCDLTLGSIQIVPPIKSYRISGLSSSYCSESAANVIAKLFDKKRSQLCAVWVTTTAAPTPFEVLNDSIRKYDALRLKYIEAYIDCMRVNERKDMIETLLSWTTTSDQDLAGYYEVSAALCGGDPGKHSKQSLLLGNGFIANVKRKASNALAEIILHDLAFMKKNGVKNDAKTKLNDHLKLAYKLFLHFNSSCKEVADFVTSNKPLAVAEALGKCYLTIQAGYRISSINFNDMDSEFLCSVLEGATSKAKTMIQATKAATSRKIKEKNRSPRRSSPPIVPEMVADLDNVVADLDKT